MKTFLILVVSLFTVGFMKPQNEHVSIFKLQYMPEQNFFRLEIQVERNSLNKLVQNLTPGIKKFSDKNDETVRGLYKYINSTFIVSSKSGRKLKFYIKEFYEMGTQKVIVLESNPIQSDELTGIKNTFLTDMLDDQTNVMEIHCNGKRQLTILSEKNNSVEKLGFKF